MKELDRNTIIITALANYYDYNDLPKEEGREVLKIIMDIQKYTRMIKFGDILSDVIDIVNKNCDYGNDNPVHILRGEIKEYFNKLKTK